MAKFSGKLYNIHSGSVQQVGWEHDKERNLDVMRIVFKNQRVYDYWPVSKVKFGEVFASDSKGKWVQSEIVNNPSISYEEVDDEDEE